MHSTYAQTQKTAQKKEASTAAAVLDASSQNEGLQRKADMANGAAQREEVPRPNNTGMPDNLKSGIESLSGFSMDDVRVHYNSNKPATVQALAYTQGTDIHVAPGQEKHLPHEAWHVAQQMAGRVSPTTNINGMPVNDNAALEHEADVMGEKAVQCKNDISSTTKQVYCQNDSVQRYKKINDEHDGSVFTLSAVKNGKRKIAVKENEASTIYISQGENIPADLGKLGIVGGTEHRLINGCEYQKFQQGKINNAIEIQDDGQREIRPQPNLSDGDYKMTQNLLNQQLDFVTLLNGWCLYDNFKNKGKRQQIKDTLVYLIRLMQNGISLKCLGNDIMDAVFAMYHIACKDDFKEVDKLALDVVKEDLNLRLSQIKNELNTADSKPLIQTECSGSAIDRSLLMMDIPVNQNGNALLATMNKCYVPAYFKKGEFPFAWEYHVGTCINQDLTDDCLYVEDAVGKSSCGKERANAHWFAHIYGVDESADSNETAVDGVNVLPYPIGENFLMNNRFNSIPNEEKPGAIKDKCGKSWEINYGKSLKLDEKRHVKLNIGLIMILNENFNFVGSFNRFKVMIEGVDENKMDETMSNDIFDEYHKNLVGIMDFMVQTANSAIDGLFIGELSKNGLADYRRYLNTSGRTFFDKDREKVNDYIVGEDFKFGSFSDMSLLSLYNANQPTQN